MLKIIDTDRQKNPKITHCMRYMTLSWSISCSQENNNNMIDPLGIRLRKTTVNRFAYFLCKLTRWERVRVSQQNCAIAHTNCKSQSALHSTFLDHIISGAAHSPDLTPWGHCLWGTLKHTVHNKKKKIQTQRMALKKSPGSQYWQFLDKVSSMSDLKVVICTTRFNMR